MTIEEPKNICAKENILHLHMLRIHLWSLVIEDQTFDVIFQDCLAN